MSFTFNNHVHSLLTAEDVHARINVNTFPFFTREIGKNGMKVPNKCGRDFLAYALAHLRPDTFAQLNLKTIERAIGWPMPPSLVWTGLPFFRLICFLTKNNLELSINGIPCQTQIDFWKSLLFPKMISCPRALAIANEALTHNRAVGMDISMGWNGLFNHVMFTWAICENDVVVFDTHKAPGLEYEYFLKSANEPPLYPDRFIMRLPMSIIEKRWKRWSRIWVIRKKLRTLQT